MAGRGRPGWRDSSRALAPSALPSPTRISTSWATPTRYLSSHTAPSKCTARVHTFADHVSSDSSPVASARAIRSLTSARLSDGRSDLKRSSCGFERNSDVLQKTAASGSARARRYHTMASQTWTAISCLWCDGAKSPYTERRRQKAWRSE